MLEKILKIENIKQWRHKKAPDQGFGKLNLIYGRNGSGKSTLCKVFNFINDNDIDAITALQPLESAAPQNLSLRIGGTTISLNALQTPFRFQVFNQEFVDSNLYIAHSKDRSQLTNYYTFSLGNVSVKKEHEIDKLKVEIEALNTQINPIESRLFTKFKNKKTVNEIRKIKAIPNAAHTISNLQVQILDLKSVEHFKKRQKLSQLIYQKPELDTSIFTLNIESLSKKAQEKVEEHISKNLKERDVFWIETGMQLVSESDNCPFCAQSLSSSSIFNLYQEFMNESYTNASNTFELNSDKLELDVRSIGVTFENMNEIIKSNTEIVSSWSDRIESIALDYDFSELASLDADLLREVCELIKSKKKDLLATVDLTKFNEIFEKISDSINFSEYNYSVTDFNAKISEFLDTLTSGSVDELQNTIDSIKEATTRFENETKDDLVRHKSLIDEKNTKTQKIKSLKAEIEKDQEDSIREHKDFINDILKNFHSMIRIKELNTDNKGKNGSTRLKYVITFIDKELSVEKEDETRHIFERVLSLGDKSALALAFFLSKFAKANNDSSIIVLDDPMSSLDNYRKDATIVEIEKLINNNYQTFVFSHDPFFLSDIQKYSILSTHAKCFEIDVLYTKSNPLDSNSSQYISSTLVGRNNYDSNVLHSYYKEYNKLFDFVGASKDEEKVEVARSIRPILEAHLRFLYPRDFDATVWLGGMIKRIREEEDPKSHFYDKNQRINIISKINEFSQTFHHADGFDTKIQSLDVQTVQSYAQETLLFITGI